MLFGFAFAHYYRKYNVVTIPEYLYYLYDIKTWKAASVLNVIGYWFFTVIQMTALGSLVTSVTGIDLKLSVLFCGLAIVSMSVAYMTESEPIGWLVFGGGVLVLGIIGLIGMMHD